MVPPAGDGEAIVVGREDEALVEFQEQHALLGGKHQGLHEEIRITVEK